MVGVIGGRVRRRTVRRMMIGCLCAVAVIVALVIVVRHFQIRGGPSRRNVDASTLLLSGETFAIGGPLGALQLRPPATRDLGHDEGHTFMRVWDSHYIDVHEEISQYGSTSGAASFQHFADARRYNEAEYPGRSGPAISPLLPGSPNTSYYFCAWVTADGCEAWQWMARYGQYDVLLVYNGNAANDEVVVAQTDFEALVRDCAAQIANRLG